MSPKFHWFLQRVILKDLKHNDGNFTEKQKIELNKVCSPYFKPLRNNFTSFPLITEVAGGVRGWQKSPQAKKWWLYFLLKILPRDIGKWGWRCKKFWKSTSVSWKVDLILFESKVCIQGLLLTKERLLNEIDIMCDKQWVLTFNLLRATHLLKDLKENTFYWHINFYFGTPFCLICFVNKHVLLVASDWLLQPDQVLRHSETWYHDLRGDRILWERIPPGKKPWSFPIF